MNNVLKFGLVFQVVVILIGLYMLLSTGDNKEKFGAFLSFLLIGPAYGVAAAVTMGGGFYEWFSEKQIED